MSHALVVSDAGLALIKRFEGFRPVAAALPQGGCVVGYGHVCADPPAAPLSEAEAEALLRQDLAWAEARVAATVLAPLSQAQFDALASLAFSIGPDAFQRSDVVKRLNAGEPIAAADAFDAWRKSAVAGEPLPLEALVRRRAAEKALFLSDEAAPAPSALVRPLADEIITLTTAPGPKAMLPELKPAHDALAARLRDILAAEPQTLHALAPPPTEAVLDGEVWSPPFPTSATETAASPAERAALAALAAFGLALVGFAALGLTGADASLRPELAYVAAPGLVALLIVAYRAIMQAASDAA